MVRELEKEREGEKKVRREHRKGDERVKEDESRGR